jgi:protein phosphatase PTC2/3
LYLEFALAQEDEIGDIERSGSCAIITLIVDDICYIANTGDSRAVMSAQGGKQVITLSNDHKPTDIIEV